MQIKNYSEFYKDLQAGSMIATYNKKWYAFFAKIIAFFTKKDTQERLDISHVILIYKVINQEDRKIVYTTEQSVSKGNHISVYTFYDNGTSSFSSAGLNVYFAKSNMNVLKHTKYLDVIDKEAEAEAVEKEVYGFSTIFAFLYRRFLKLVGIQPLNYRAETYDDICSAYIWSLQLKGEVIDKTLFDEYNPPSPSELLKIMYNKKITAKPYRVKLD
jgi:hypothetical protein